MRSAIAALGVYRVGWGLITVSAILLFRATYNDVADPDAGLEDLGRAFVLGGIGILGAALVAPTLARRFGPRRVIWVALLVAAGSELVLGLGVHLGHAARVSRSLAGAGQALKICVDTIVQSGIEDTYRGRVFSVYDLVFNVGFVAASHRGRADAAAGRSVAAGDRPRHGCWTAGGLAYARVSRAPMSRRSTTRSGAR